MGLNERGQGRGRGVNGNFHFNGRRGGRAGYSESRFKPGPGVFGTPPMGYPPQISHGGTPFSGKNNFPPSKFYGNFQRTNVRRFPYKNEPPVLEIDLTKPWVTDKIKDEERKKEELLTTWKMSQDDEDWSKFKAQKMNVQSLYATAKAEYIASHPNEAALWQNTPQLKKLYCETCDKPFRTDDDLIIHESEHETCGRDGCTFTAHPKVISKHIRMQHDSGLYERIGVLQTKEDIAKWIEERKKRYPTKKLVEEKKAMEEEKITRGERIKDDDSRFNKSFKSRNKKEVKKNFEKKSMSRNRRQKKKKKKPVTTEVEEEIQPNERRGVPAFTGIRDPSKAEPTEENEIEEDNLGISDDEWETETKPEDVKPVLNNSLGLLAAVYDSNEENSDAEIVQIQKENTVPDDDDNSPPEEVATIHRKSPQLEDTKKTKIPHKRKALDKNTRQRKKVKSNFNSNERTSEGRSLTLLEKLLKNEIRHERNVILQCVHYIVKHNFFKT